MATPTPDAALVDMERRRRQVLSHPLARGLTHTDTREYLAAFTLLNSSHSVSDPSPRIAIGITSGDNRSPNAGATKVANELIM